MLVMQSQLAESTAIAMLKTGDMPAPLFFYDFRP
jgi:hypothetical protein